MAEPFEVQPYSIDVLKTILTQKSGIDSRRLDKKIHLTFFKEYFEYPDIGAKTIIVENTYIDKDYLQDYAAYAVRCFHSYGRFCTRLHFFSCEISEAEFKDILSRPSETKPGRLQDSYIGFVVVKPLPLTMIGRTCLKSYNHDNHRRQYPLNRRYEANLFGIPLAVDTIAYQEQDSVVAACASTALWSLFQRTGAMFQHQIPSPVDITKAATINVPHSNRHLPNKGLSIEQMAQVVRNVGLEPYLVSVSTDQNVKFHLYSVCKGTIHAYLKAKIPLILAIHLYDQNNIDMIGMHTVTVSGYSLSKEKKATKFYDKEFYLTSSRINEIYVHDDGVGPFARMEFDEKQTPFPLNPFYQSDSIHTSWINTKFSPEKPSDVRAIPYNLLIALHHKIRIPYDLILDIIADVNQYLVPGFSKGLDTVEWDIHLVEVSVLKNEILNSTSISDDERFRVLCKDLPKYIWRALGKQKDDGPAFDLLFDATDIDQGKLFLDMIAYDPKFVKLLKDYFENIPLQSTGILRPSVKAIIHSFEQFIEPAQEQGSLNA